MLQACPRAPARVGVSALGLSGGFWEALVGQYFSAASIARACRFSIACLLTVQAAPVAALWHGRARGFPQAGKGGSEAGENVDVPAVLFGFVLPCVGNALPQKKSKKHCGLVREGFRASVRGARTAKGKRALWRRAMGGDADVCDWGWGTHGVRDLLMVAARRCVL